MSDRIEFELTLGELARLHDAAKPVPYMIIGGVEPRSPQQNANDVWRSLGAEKGFIWDSVRPAPGKGERYFLAIPTLQAEDAPAVPARTNTEQEMVEVRLPPRASLAEQLRNIADVLDADGPMAKHAAFLTVGMVFDALRAEVAPDEVSS